MTWTSLKGRKLYEQSLKTKIISTPLNSNDLGIRFWTNAAVIDKSWIGPVKNFEPRTGPNQDHQHFKTRPGLDNGPKIVISSVRNFQ